MAWEMARGDVSYESSDKHEHNLVLKQMFYSFSPETHCICLLSWKVFSPHRNACFYCLSIFHCIIDECGRGSISAIWQLDSIPYSIWAFKVVFTLLIISMFSRILVIYHKWIYLRPFSLFQGKLGVPGLPGYPGRQGPKVTEHKIIIMIILVRIAFVSHDQLTYNPTNIHYIHV